MSHNERHHTCQRSFPHKRYCLSFNDCIVLTMPFDPISLSNHYHIHKNKNCIFMYRSMDQIGSQPTLDFELFYITFVRINGKICFVLVILLAKFRCRYSLLLSILNSFIDRLKGDNHIN